MTEIYECRICGVVTETKGRLCEPEAQDDTHDYCGTTRERAMICDDMKVQVNYVCGNCGRPTEMADLVCKPLTTN